MNGNIFVFRPGGSPGNNVFTNWPSLISAKSGVEGRKILEFDDSLSPLTPRRCEIPAGTWPMADVMWAGFGPRPGIPRTVVHILSGAVFTDLRMIGGQITIVNLATGTDPSPVSDFGSGPIADHLQIGLRDDGGNTQLVNTGEVSMFDLGENSATFFIQNCLFGMPQGITDVTNLHPLVRMKANNNGTNQLTLNLLGQNQTGPNVVCCEPGIQPDKRVTVLFGALSSSALVARIQDKITTHGKLSFGPQGRIQRLVIPRPSNPGEPFSSPPATSSQTIPTPNALVRCDGTHAFTQDLPSITKGFTLGAGGVVDLYTGGQEVVVAEVVGGNHLSVRPAPGDTIDGDPGSVRIGKRGSKTFVSDGVSNWITISEVGHP
jgi:hypothetical protein